MPTLAAGLGPRLRGTVFFLRRKLIAKRPLRLAKDDNKNNHRAETEVGWRLIG